MQLALPLAKYPRAEPRAALYQQLEERLRRVNAIPACRHHDHRRPSAVSPPTGPWTPADAGEKLPDVTMVSISPGYFDTLGIKLQRGRSLTTPTARPAGGHRQPAIRDNALRRPGSARPPPSPHDAPPDSAAASGGQRRSLGLSNRTPAQLPGSRSGPGGLPSVSRGSAAVHVAHVVAPAIPRALRRWCANRCVRSSRTSRYWAS